MFAACLHLEVKIGLISTSVQIEISHHLLMLDETRLRPDTCTTFRLLYTYKHLTQHAGDNLNNPNPMMMSLGGSRRQLPKCAPDVPVLSICSRVSISGSRQGESRGGKCWGGCLLNFALRAPESDNLGLKQKNVILTGLGGFL